MLEKLFFEWLGTSILLCLGNGVCANVTLKKTNAKDSDWIVVAMGWSMAVYGGVLVSSSVSGAHLNPAVTLAFCLSGKFSWSLLPFYTVAQLLGAMTGALLVYLIYKKQFDETASSRHSKDILGVFATAPNIKSPFWNLCSEALASFMFIVMVFFIEGSKLEGGSQLGTGSDIPIGLGSIGALPVALIVLAIGLSLGGPTGYAINPVRDFGPRLIYSILPLGIRKDAEWSYAAIPVLGPFIGAALASLLYLLATSL